MSRIIISFAMKVKYFNLGAKAIKPLNHVHGSVFAVSKVTNMSSSNSENVHLVVIMYLLLCYIVQNKL